MDNFELFTIDGPERTLLLMRNGVLIGHDKAADFNKGFKAKHASNRIRGIPVQEYDRLTFTGRPGFPDLLPNDADGTLDLSTHGLVSALTGLAIGRDSQAFELPKDVGYFFEKRFNSYWTAVRWLQETFPVLIGHRDPDGYNYGVTREAMDPAAKAFWTMLNSKTVKAKSSPSGYWLVDFGD